MSKTTPAIEAIARTVDGTELRRSECGVFIQPSTSDNDGECHLSIAEIGEALRLIGWNRADVFPGG